MPPSTARSAPPARCACRSMSRPWTCWTARRPGTLRRAPGQRRHRPALPRGSAPTLALILGGTGARLEDLVGAFSALNRDGIAGHVRYRSEDPTLDRRLVSPGAAWIVREILEGNPRPGYSAGMFDTARRPRVAWKTGTSYGYRDAWALGSTRRYTVGVWVGRPDGTPLPGQYGAITALPLMFEVIDALPRQRSDAAPAPMPASVSKLDICWPTGEAADLTPAPCARRRSPSLRPRRQPATDLPRTRRPPMAARPPTLHRRRPQRPAPDCPMPATAP